MGTPYIGEIRMVGFSFAPAGWALCNGQLMPISGNDALYNLIGTTYGGDGVTTFALPDIQSRFPVHQGQGAGLSNYVIGETGGAETVTLTSNQIPSHRHGMNGLNLPATSANPSGNMVAKAAPSTGGTVIPTYAPASSAPVTMAAGAIAQAGGNQPHDNVPPFQVVNFVISLFGVFPTQN